MKCKGTGELLTAYLDGEVTEKEKTLVEAHLSNCQQCQAELETLKAMQTSLRGVLTSMAEEVAPSADAWKNVRAKIEKKSGWFENLGNILSNQKWQGAVVTAMVVVVVVSVTVWQISGGGSPALVAPAPAPVPASVPAPTTPKLYDTPAAPPPAQVTVNPPTVTVPAPAPVPAPTTPPPAVTPPPTATPPPVTTPPLTTPPVTTAPPPNINVGAPPPTVTVQAPPPAAVVIQAPPPAQVTVNPPAVTVQSPPPAQVTVNVPAQSPQPVNAPLWFWSLLTVTLLAAVMIIFVSRKRAKV